MPILAARGVQRMLVVDRPGTGQHCVSSHVPSVSSEEGLPFGTPGRDLLFYDRNGSRYARALQKGPQ